MAGLGRCGPSAACTLPADLRRHFGDRIFFHRRRYLEVKRKGAGLSPDQQRIADHKRRAGHAFETVDSVEAAIEVLVCWSVVRTLTVQ